LKEGTQIGSPYKEVNSSTEYNLLETTKNKKPIFVGIAGGTASGKTTVCEEVFKRVRIGDSQDECTMLPLDCFYKECTPE
jgi:pantothenate kinase